MQLIFRLTPLTFAAKSNEKIVNQKLCNTVLILDFRVQLTNTLRVILVSKEAKKTEIDESFISLVTYRTKFGAAGL